jgi:hypothetical protein
MKFDKIFNGIINEDEKLTHISRARELDKVDPSIAKIMSSTGLKDGDKKDDMVKISRATWKASDLKPSQSTMVLQKSLGMALFMLKTGKVGGDLGAIVSSDGFIMDGHHRWSATILASGKEGKVGGYKANLSGSKLQPVLNILTKGEFNVNKGKKGSGSIEDYTPLNIKKELENMVEIGISGEFPWSPMEVAKVLKSNFGSIPWGINIIAGNVRYMERVPPVWAPSREQMPVIEPEQVPTAAKKLSKGEVDHSAPFSESKSKKPLNQKRRLKQILSQEPKKSRGFTTKPEIPHKDKRKKSRQQMKSDLKKGKYESKFDNLYEQIMNEKSPKGWTGTVRAMIKNHPDKFDPNSDGKDGKINPYALAWSMDKKGHKPHYKKTKSSTEGNPVKKKKYKDEK